MRSHLNVGFGSDVSIMDLAKLVSQTCGFKGKILTDPSMPDGPPQKLMNTERLNTLGWKPEISLEKGLELAYKDFMKHLSNQTLRNL
jgi:nucleoside-diphosphate-sugar epimerase